jgi:hypothetical protein
MGMINLADVLVSYEGQTLPAIHLISRLQTQLREATGRIATIAETLGVLQTALLNSHTVEVKLTLSKEDYGRLRSLEGVDDSERIRKAIMAVIHPEGAGISIKTSESRPAAPYVESRPAPYPVESASVVSKSAEPTRSPVPESEAAKNTVKKQWTNYMTVFNLNEADISKRTGEPKPAAPPGEPAPAMMKPQDPPRSLFQESQPFKKTLLEQPVDPGAPIEKKPPTICPICQSLFGPIVE